MLENLAYIAFYDQKTDTVCKMIMKNFSLKNVSREKWECDNNNASM